MQFASSGRKALLTIGTLIGAPLWFAFGLIAPLTPSTGFPSLWELLVFWVAPLVALGSIWVWDGSLIARCTSIVVLALVLLPYLWLLSLMYEAK